MSNLPDPEPPKLASSPEQPPDRPPTAAAMSLEQWLETLRRTDRAFYNIMAMEVWSIAKTMDTLFPGFWHKFMSNRQTAMKQYVELKKKTPSPVAPTEPVGEKRHEA
jgi:hypothetical protein